MGTQNARLTKGAGAGSAIALILGTLGFSSNVRAVIIIPGKTVTPSGTETVSGTTAETDSNVPFTGTDSLDDVVFYGTISSQAVVDSSTGDIDFIYQFTNNPNSADSIEHLTVGGFTGFTTDADYLTGLGTAPDSITRSSSGYNVGFQFLASDAVLQGATTDTLFIKTDAPTYTIGNAVLQDGGNGNVAVLVPAVPEPATIALICIGGGALGIRRRRKA
jgi:hypothetical protein